MAEEKKQTAHSRANIKYRKKSVTRVDLSLYPKDKDIVEWLEAQQNKNKAIKAAIRAYMRAAEAK